jgi:cobalt-zinc-cadmium efflux system outer membrane protein
MIAKLKIFEVGRRIGLLLAMGCHTTVCGGTNEAASAAPGSSGVLSASKSEGTGLTLAEAQRLAFSRSWDLLAAKSDVALATAQRIVAREFPNPSFSLSMQKISFDSHSAGTVSGNGLWERNYDSIAAINQLIEMGGKRKARQASAGAGLLAAEARLADARRLLNQGVAQNYVAARLAAEKREILRASAESLRQEASIAAVRRRAGEISTADQTQIEIAAERLELDSQAADADARNSLITLETLLGEPRPGGHLILKETLAALAETRVLPETSAGALALRPDVLAAETTRKKAAADLRLQEAQRVPDPTFLAQYEHEPPDQPNTFGLGISFPLPLWNRNRGNIAAAQATLAQAETQVRKLEAQAAAETASAQNTYQAAQARWRRYREELEPKSRRVREAMVFSYQKGNASLLDLLSAQRTDNDVRLGTAQAAADTVTAAAALQAARNDPLSISYTNPPASTP